ncbi:unnamed protein product, partial [Ixodes persulcatus]
IFLPYLSVTEESKNSEVQTFYQDEVVFITGATGFLGKALLEKLLRSCPGIRRIYILIRPKKNASPTGRLEVLLKSECFKRLHEEYPESLNKVVGVEGNLTDENLGLKSSDCNRLTSEVSVVFHCAASIRFNDTLRSAVKINMEGTKSVLELCHKMKNRKAVVYVSTAFVNCDHEVLEERLYPSMVKPDDIIALTKTMDEVDLVKLTPELLGTKPNTYIFTKHLAESIVAENGQRLPLVIVRPSIVSASWREPVAGWLDGLQGGNLLVSSGVTGAVTTIVADKMAVMDIIPVDVVANALIVAASQAPLRGSPTQRSLDPSITTCSVSLLIQTRTEAYSLSRLPVRLIWRLTPPASSASSRAAAKCIERYSTTHYNRLQRHQDETIKGDEISLLGSLVYAFHLTKYITTEHVRNVKFTCPTLPYITQIFNMDIRSINWDIYWEDYVKGIRRYLAKQQTTTISDLPVQKER